MFEIGKSINNFGSWFINHSIVRGVIENPFYMAGIITIFIFVLMTFIFKNTEVPQERLNSRVALWAFVGTALLMFLNNKVLSQNRSAMNNVRDFNASWQQGNSEFENTVDGQPVSDVDVVYQEGVPVTEYGGGGAADTDAEEKSVSSLTDLI